jgi:hypothetical protein
MDAICLRRIQMAPYLRVLTIPGARMLLSNLLTVTTSNSPLAFTYQVNISLIVNDDEAEQCVRSLHSAFFESDVSELDGKCVSDNGSVQLRSEE